jgi:hypothetical protein
MTVTVLSDAQGRYPRQQPARRQLLGAITAVGC